MLTSRAQAEEFIERNLKPQLVQEYMAAGGEQVILGQVQIISEDYIRNHKLWEYHIEGEPVTTRQQWLLDTGETVVTTSAEDERTPELAYTKKFGHELEISTK